MIKKFKFLLITILLFSSKTFAFSPQIEQEIYVGCYSNSKQYIGPEKAKKYCLCTIKKLNEKFNDEEINNLFKKKPEQIIESTKFASLFCEKKFH
tara:strand:+ start:55 stop:339 length:285 start_codon:yes stop_codon:yes gene_type:complete